MPKQTLQQKIRRALGRFTAKRIAMILLGTAILSFGIHNIHRRTAITEGGVIGLVLLINHWLGVPASVASPLLDAASYALAFKFLGWDFLLSAGVASVSLAGFYRIWECLPPMLPDALAAGGGAAGRRVRRRRRGAHRAAGRVQRRRPRPRPCHP